MGKIRKAVPYNPVSWFGCCSDENMGEFKVGEVSKSVFCVGCGCVLTVSNRSLDSQLCKICWMVELALIEQEDRHVMQLIDEERSVVERSGA
jgi:hypothetical protein